MGNCLDFLDELEKIVDKITEKKQTKPVIIDLSKINYIVSNGLASLIKMNKQFKQKGQKFGLVKLTKPVDRVFHSTKLNLSFSIFPNAKEALINLKETN